MGLLSFGLEVEKGWEDVDDIVFREALKAAFTAWAVPEIRLSHAKLS